MLFEFINLLKINKINQVKDLAELPLATVERILKDAGAKRVSKKAVILFAEWMEKTIKDLAQEAGKLAEHSGRRTITEEDVLLAKKRLGL